MAKPDLCGVRHEEMATSSEDGTTMSDLLLPSIFLTAIFTAT